MEQSKEKEIEQFTHKYCWENLPGDQTWSNNFYDCALGGYEIAQKESKKEIKDKYNHYNSKLKEATKTKLDRRDRTEYVIKLEAKVELLKEMMND